MFDITWTPTEQAVRWTGAGHATLRAISSVCVRLSIAIYHAILISHNNAKKCAKHLLLFANLKFCTIGVLIRSKVTFKYFRSLTHTRNTERLSGLTHWHTQPNRMVITWGGSKTRNLPRNYLLHWHVMYNESLQMTNILKSNVWFTWKNCHLSMHRV